MINYNKQSTNSRGICVLSSWLNACNIETKNGEVKGCDLIATDFKGNPRGISTIYVGGPVAPSDSIIVALHDIISPKQNICLNAFHKITQELGFGTPIPINRGQTPNKKQNYEAEFDLVAFRHKEFRAAPNPAPEVFKLFDNVINYSTRHFYSRNLKLCRRFGIEIQDLKQYALVWTVNFNHKYKIANPTVNDNERLLAAHLKQRFAELANLLLKKSKNCFADKETVQIGLYENSCDNDSVCMKNPQNEENDDADYINRKSQLDTTSEVKRRKSADILLNKLLNELPHDTMLEKLNEILENKVYLDLHKDVNKRIKLHKESCEICKNKFNLNK